MAYTSAYCVPPSPDVASISLRSSFCPGFSTCSVRHRPSRGRSRVRAFPNPPTTSNPKELAETRTAISAVIPDQWDTVVIGSGPVGSTIAKYLASGGDAVHPSGNIERIEGNQRVLVVDAGQRLSPRAGEHVKNSLLYQIDHGEGQRKFAQFIASTIEPISRNPSPSSESTALPNTWQPGVNNDPDEPFSDFSPNLTNPDQKPFFNLAGATIAYKVGGMGTHWTCSTPRPHPTIEMNELFPSDPLYSIGESLLRTDQTAYDNELRNVLVGNKLRSLKHLKHLNDTPFGVQPLPLAVRRRNAQFVDWTGPDAILGDLATRDDDGFKIADQLITKRLECGPSGRVECAVLEDPRGIHTSDGSPGEIRVYAKNFVVACGQVASAQLLAASGFSDLTANGRFLTEQPFMFTRIILDRKLIDKLRDLQPGDPLFRFKDIIDKWSAENPKDPIPIPRNGLASGEVQQWIPVSEGRPWHVQVHNDNFFGQNLNTAVDDRLVVGLRWFTLPVMSRKNCVTFSDTYRDIMGLPQPTFDYTFRRGDISIVDRAYEDLLRTMVELGAPVPGSGTDPQFLENGSALHIHGANRIGFDKQSSVADPDGRVWDRENLWIAGNSCIPKGIAVNPTLTSVCLAIRSSMSILGKDTSGTFAGKEREYLLLNVPVDE